MSGSLPRAVPAGGRFTLRLVNAPGGTGNDTGTGGAVDAAGTVHLAGQFRGTVDFDPDPLGTYDLTSNGAQDFFFVKLRQN